MKSTHYLLVFIFVITTSFAQKKESEMLYNADNGNGYYTNPILYSDYSDPDVIRVKDKFYMTASSFNCIPGLPILESYDLVNWKLISYALPKQLPEDLYNKTQHGNGVWAPCMRFHNNQFYIYYPDPDFGIYMIKAKNIKGPWTEPILIKAGKGLIDPSPLWDDNGKAYLGYAFAGSRAGIKSMLAICSMNAEGTKANNDDVMIIDGHEDESTIEGPKLYKRNGYYYVFAPAGGVSTGWQTVLRSKNIWGPYEKRKVLQQGKTNINGPHQGAWIQTQTGEDWFIHFQDKDAFGRILHLQPMKWENNWPIIGSDEDHDGIGEPVNTYRKPNVGKTYPKTAPQTSDEFNVPSLGLQWQWHANPQITWGLPNAYGYYQLNCIPKSKEYKNLWQAPNMLLQKLAAPNFTATAKITYSFRNDGEEGGLVIMGNDFTYLRIKKSGSKIYLSQIICKNAEKNGDEVEFDVHELSPSTIYLQTQISEDGKTQFYFSEDNISFQKIGNDFEMKKGKWIGAKIGFVAQREGFINDAGNLKIDWIRFKK